MRVSGLSTIPDRARSGTATTGAGVSVSRRKLRECVVQRSGGCAFNLSRASAVARQEARDEVADDRGRAGDRHVDVSAGVSRSPDGPLADAGVLTGAGAVSERIRRGERPAVRAHARDRVGRRGLTTAAWQPDLAHAARIVRSECQAASTIAAMPCPPPMHAVARPRARRRRRNSSASVSRSRVPVIPSG